MRWMRRPCAIAWLCHVASANALGSEAKRLAVHRRSRALSFSAARCSRHVCRARSAPAYRRRAHVVFARVTSAAAYHQVRMARAVWACSMLRAASQRALLIDISSSRISTHELNARRSPRCSPRSAAAAAATRARPALVRRAPTRASHPLRSRRAIRVYMASRAILRVSAAYERRRIPTRSARFLTSAATLALTPPSARTTRARWRASRAHCATRPPACTFCHCLTATECMYASVLRRAVSRWATLSHVSHARPSRRPLMTWNARRRVVIWLRWRRAKRSHCARNKARDRKQARRG